VLVADRPIEIPQRFEKRKDNAKRARMAFTRLVKANIDGTSKPLLITLTYAENLTDLRQGYKDFRSFIKSLRYKYGQEFSYIAVPEFQRRGAVHFHALFWSLPDSVFTQQRITRVVDRIWAKGFVYMKQTDGSPKLSTYLAKYMSKSYLDSRLTNQKCYVSSMNIKRPIIQEIMTSINYILEDWKISTVEPCEKNEYGTQWLGRCNKIIYKLIKQ